MENAGPGSRGTGSRGVENAGSNWKTRGLMENAGFGGKRGFYVENAGSTWKTRGLRGNTGRGNVFFEKI